METKKEKFFFETKEEESVGIATMIYPNGNKIKKVKLTNGREAIVRMLKGKDFVETQKLIQDNKAIDFQTANMSRAITFDNGTEPPEYFLNDLFQEDYSTLLVAYGSLNFQSAAKKLPS